MKFITGTKVNWIISLVDGLYRITDDIRLLSDELDLHKRVFIIWAWNNEHGRDNIVKLAGNDYVYLQDSQSEEVFGKGKIVASLGTRDFNHYWKQQIKFGGQETLGWRYPYLIELIKLDGGLLQKIESSPIELKEKIARNQVVTTRGFFKNLVSASIRENSLDRGKKIWGDESEATQLMVESAERKFKEVALLLDDKLVASRKVYKLRSLERYQDYDREEIHAMFAAHTPFTPQGGVWGLQGIAPIPSRDGDFVFFVTLGHKEGHHQFDEGVTESGVLTWQSQPQQDLKNLQIKQLIQHDELKNTIYLFLRPQKNKREYTYLGQLKYLTHDKDKERPVYFKWQIVDWDIKKEFLNQLGLELQPDNADEPSLRMGPGVIVEEPPAPFVSAEGSPTAVFLGKRNVDYAAQDERNRGLGLAGEVLILNQEKQRLLAAGKRRLAEQISQISIVEGDGAGYDILSFDENGEKKYIEVKTTKGPKSTAFYITQKELIFSQQNSNNYYLYRIFEFRSIDDAKYFIKNGPLDKMFSLLPIQYRAR